MVLAVGFADMDVIGLGLYILLLRAAIQFRQQVTEACIARKSHLTGMPSSLGLYQGLSSTCDKITP